MDLDGVEVVLETIADELARANRLKEFELRMSKVYDRNFPSKDYSDFLLKLDKAVKGD